MGMRDIFGKWRRTRRGGNTVLGRLARDTRGNVLAIMAAALIPFCGMVGGGLDLSRMYLTKTRLQHACDAGALAGRKRMGAGTWTANSNAANAAALEYFNANYTSSGMYGGSAPTVAFSENAGKVSGNASATLPMTLMRVLGKTTETLSVTCDAEMRLPNTDIMFVLDTTGSMGDTLPGDTKTKIQALRGAVKCFYEIVARLDTTEVCGTGSGPSGGTGTQVQIRFGFVPYSTNVNVGKLLPTSWFANSWNYQTREAQWTSSGGTSSWVTTGQPLVTSVAASSAAPSAAYCNNTVAATLNTSVTVNTSSTTRTITEVKYTTAGLYTGGICYGTATTTITNQSYVTTGGTKTFKEWQYKQAPVNIALLKNGSTWNNSFQWPVGANGTNKTINWDGCIEERHTVRTTNFSPIPSDADDLDLDLTPSQGDPDTLWGMALPDVTYLRSSGTFYDFRGNRYWNTGSFTLSTQNTTSDYYGMSRDDYACPTESRRLQSWNDASTFESYVDSLTPTGNTYHDIGLIWGGRFMSPTGMFRADNEFTPQGGEIDRHMIFMTDGDACTSADNYTAYGIPWFDRRQTAQNAIPTGGCTTNLTTLTEQVNLRTEALCTAIRNKNITLWVISFGALAPTTLTRLQNCATAGRYFSANNSTQLYDTFANIANQISQLRLTK